MTETKPREITPEQIMRADRLWVSWIINDKDLTLDERNELEELEALCKPFDHKEVLFKHYDQANERIKELEAENKSLQAQVDVMMEALKVCALGETQFDGVEAMHSARQALAKVAEIKGKNA